MARSAGILLHITSLPSRFGAGDFGPESDRFIDWLAEAGFQWWQVLPLNPPGYGWSPYQPWSVFAGNRLMISPELLAADGLLSEEELTQRALPVSSRRADFEAAEHLRRNLLECAFDRFDPDEEFREFERSNGFWLEDAVLFDVIHRSRRAEWTSWPHALRDRSEGALHEIRDRETRSIEIERFAQFQFFRQHQRLRVRAADRGIRLIGDLPIFVAHDSADVWANRDLYDLDERGRPHVVAGVPPDYFSPSGQRWGNPLYRWDQMEADGYEWWLSRLDAAFQLYDVVRLDHFRGFESYWEVPASHKDATSGTWKSGPGINFFNAVQSRFSNPPLLAEDLGDITPEVDQLRLQAGLPGMAVLQFGPSDPASPHLPHNFTGNDRVVYTGTHDNDTTAGWWRGLPGEDRKFVSRYTGLSAWGAARGAEAAAAMRRLAYGSIADLAVIPMQDLLALGSSCRMNRPGQLVDANWRWRMKRGELDQLDPLAHRRELATFGRVNSEL